LGKTHARAPPNGFVYGPQWILRAQEIAESAIFPRKAMCRGAYCSIFRRKPSPASSISDRDGSAARAVGRETAVVRP